MKKNTQEKSGSQQSSSSRRDFLKLASLGTVAGGVAVATGEAAHSAENNGTEKSGYRETDHVKTYYELSRF